MVQLAGGVATFEQRTLDPSNSLSRAFSPSHLLTVPLLLTLFELVERFEHAVWSPRTVFEITVCSQN